MNQIQQMALQEYPAIWQKLINEWKLETELDTLWLTYSANYLITNGGFKWAIDPYSLFTRLSLGEQPDFEKDLSGIKLVVLTHAHSDHLDLNILKAIQNLDIQWVIPEFMLDRIGTENVLKKARIIVPEIEKPLLFEKLKLTPFKGLHFRGNSGIDEMGYLAEFNGRRWLFPGDNRRYDFHQLPAFGQLNGIFAHLWLGKAEALNQNPSLLNDFCDFFSRFQTERIVITHLREYGREPEDFWDLHHFHKVKNLLRRIVPEIKLTAALIGERIDL